MEILSVGFGGFLGAIARHLVYLLESTLSSHRFPLGTVFINLAGCFLAGILLAMSERANPSFRHLLLLASVGFTGSFTTFSTFSVETLHLLRSGSFNLAFISIGTNICGGIAGVWLGFSLYRVLRGF